MTDRELYKAAIDLWGRELQLDMLQEECAELIAVINRWRRKRAKGSDLLDEIADVEIMIEQARVMFGDSSINDAKREKLRRLEQRVLEARG